MSTQANRTRTKTTARRSPAAGSARAAVQPAPSPWTFLSNHAHVLICIADNPEVRMRDVAARVGVTERAVQRIVSELEDAGYLSHERVGRCNRYNVHTALPLRHPIEQHCLVSSLLKPILSTRRGD
jgi:hypothetical protein